MEIVCGQESTAFDVLLIHGVDGIGKTTLAKYVYDNSYEKFESSSFVSDIGNILSRGDYSDGIVRLQKQLISDLLGIEGGINVLNVDVVLSMIKDVLNIRKVLLVLDDVEHPDQLDMLLGTQKSFRPGSKIMITSRNKNLLHGYNLVYSLFEVQPLNDEESLQLFNLHAFGQKNEGAVTEDDKHLVNKLIWLCRGVPLYLSVLGSLLYARYDVELKMTLESFAHVVNHLDGKDEMILLEAQCQRTELVQGFDHYEMPYSDNNKNTSSGDNNNNYKYDVFFSFRGDDSRSKTFTDYLYDALQKAGHPLSIFKDFADTRWTGKRKEALKQIIQHCKCCIIIFSKSYVSSRWCLDELVVIADHFSTSPNRILPVYYDVEKSDVMHQLGILREVFSVYEKEIDNEMDDIKKRKLVYDLRKIRAALKQIVNHSPGFNFANVSSPNGNGLNLVQKIVEDVGEDDNDDDVQMRLLSIGYDLLEEKEKAIFLHIACFFIGMDKDYVATILEGCGFYAEIGVRNLIDRCLLKVNEEDKKLMMHRVIQDMAREIVRKESPLEPGKRSRLWRHEDTLHVLTTKTGTNATEGLALEFRPSKDEISSSSPPSLVTIETNRFSSLKNLSILKLHNVELIGEYGDFPKNLRWLSLGGLSRPPEADFPMENLVALELNKCTFNHAWSGTKSLPLLQWLILSECHELKMMPDLSGFSKLETLIIVECSNLVEIHESIVELERLRTLNIKGCNKLVKLSKRVVGKLRSIDQLLISDCSKQLSTPFV